MKMMQIGPETTMGEILKAFPSARIGLFQRYHIGGCQACGYELGETLAQVREKHGIQDPCDEMVRCIEKSDDVEAKLHVSRDEFKKALERRDLLLVLDARTTEEFQGAHLPGAHHLTLDLKFEALDTWDKETPIVFYSDQGKRSLDAASYFQAYGFTNVRSLDGGMDGWE